MKKNASTRETFITLRAQGASYAEICDKLAICKQTAVNWSRDHQVEINNLKSIELDAMLKQHRLHYQGRIEILGDLLQRLKVEFSTRDLSRLSAETLLNQIVKITTLVAQEKESPVFKKMPDNLDDVMTTLAKSHVEEWML